MLRPPPRPAEERHGWVGGTSTLLESLAGPSHPARGGHPCLQILELCLNGLGSPGGSRQQGLPEGTGSGDNASSGSEHRPTLAQALLPSLPTS